MVDVAIPTARRRELLIEAVDGILAQTFSDWRIQISEDGPGDPDLGTILAPYLVDERVSHRCLGKQMGAAHNVTTVLTAGDAPYVCLHHDDDRLEPEALERRVDFLERHPESGFVFSPHVDIDEEGRLRARRELPFETGVLAPQEIFTALARQNVVSTMNCVLIRRAALDEAGAYADEGFERLYDWELWLRLAARFPVGFLEVYDAHYRIHEMQVSAGTRDADEFLRILDRVDELAAEHSLVVGVSAKERGRQRSALWLSLALDRVLAGDRRGARAALGAAVADSSLVVTDPRFAAVLAAMAFGRPGRSAVRWLRVRAQVRLRRLPDVERALAPRRRG